MGLFNKKTNIEKFEIKQNKLNSKITKEFEKAQDFLAVSGIEIEGLVFALISLPSSLSSPTRNVWAINETGITKVSGIPPAHPREVFPFKEIESITVSTEISPTVAFRFNGRYVTFKADAVPAQYFVGIISEKLNQYKL